MMHPIPLAGYGRSTLGESFLMSHEQDFDNVLPELPELQADRQQTLPITFDSLAKDQHTENASGSGTDQEKFYYVSELSDI